MENTKLTRQELHRQVWSEPMISIARKFEVSDYELRKLCKKLQIPTPRSGHWQKVRTGKTVPVPELPADASREQEIDLRAITAPRGSLKPLALLQKEIEENLKGMLKVPTRLTNPDKLITAFQANIEERSRKYRFTGLINPHYGFMDIKVSKRLLSRTLILMDTLI
ncbi:hypothetical protein [Pontibacter pamirensis]|uniref:hypothetical protein n=1 Tax=Pontibacter pamirensis TaxID=2562824 RepID=UPI0013895DB7|nr:hypothetical protein [Pontibacter pamirensis]